LPDSASLFLSWLYHRDCRSAALVADTDSLNLLFQPLKKDPKFSVTGMHISISLKCSFPNNSVVCKTLPAALLEARSNFSPLDWQQLPDSFSLRVINQFEPLYRHKADKVKQMSVGMTREYAPTN
jgi:hypothetical protein